MVLRFRIMKRAAFVSTLRGVEVIGTEAVSVKTSRLEELAVPEAGLENIIGPRGIRAFPAALPSCVDGIGIASVDGSAGRFSGIRC